MKSEEAVCLHIYIENLKAQITELKSEVERLKAQPTAADERKKIVSYLGNKAVYLRVDGYYEGERALARAARAIEHGEHWPMEGEKP